MDSNALLSEGSPVEHRPAPFAQHAAGSKELRQEVDVLRRRSADNLSAIGLLLPAIERTLTAIEMLTMPPPNNGSSVGGKPPQTATFVPASGWEESLESQQQESPLA